MSDIKPGRLSAEQLAVNFDDLVPPLGRKKALVEASRCYFCHDAPCIEACPTGIDIPSFIRKIQTNNVKGSAMDILSANIMGGTCARVCPTEILCEQVCVRNTQEDKPVKIGQLQRYSTDWLFDQQIQPFTRAASTGKTVAVIGAGPAGLACAHALAQHGHTITVFERRAKAGGLNEHGIAAYKMAHDFAAREVDFITALGGIEIRYGQSLGEDITLAELKAQFDAVFIGTGLGDTNRLGLTNEAVSGVMDAVDYIEQLRQSPTKADLAIGRDVVVIGGGNTAIDISVQAKRLGAKTVTLAYRRGPEAMSATAHEQEIAQLNGVILRHWAMPTQIVAKNDALSAVALETTRIGADGSLEGTGEVEVLKADQLFKAIGQSLIAEGLQDLVFEGKKLAVNEARATTLEGVYAGGDAIGLSEDLTVAAVEDGKIAARSIHAHLSA